MYELCYDDFYRINQDNSYGLFILKNQCFYFIKKKLKFNLIYFVNDDVYAVCWHDAMLCLHFAVVDVVVLFVRPNCEEHD